MSITVILKKNWSWSELRLIFGRLRNDENLDFSFVKFSNSSFLRLTPKIRLALKSTFFILWDWNCICFHHLYVYIGWCTQIPKFQPRRAISRGGCITPPPGFYVILRGPVLIGLFQRLSVNIFEKFGTANKMNIKFKTSVNVLVLSSFCASK